MISQSGSTFATVGRLESVYFSEKKKKSYQCVNMHVWMTECVSECVFFHFTALIHSNSLCSLCQKKNPKLHFSVRLLVLAC